LLYSILQYVVQYIVLSILHKGETSILSTVNSLIRWLGIDKVVLKVLLGNGSRLKILFTFLNKKTKQKKQ